MAVSVTITGIDELLGILANLSAGIDGATHHAISVGSDLPQAAYVTYGTAPHVITASAAQALYWPGAAHPVKRVNHPGTRPNPFIDTALANSQAAVAEVVSSALTTVAAGGPVSAIVEGLDLAGDLVAEAAKAAAPVRTGALRDSITARYTGAP